jgi:hypothetical protein
LAGAIALVAVLALVIKAMERRASKDLDGADDLARIVRQRLGRSDSSGGGPGDGGGVGN